MTTTCWILWMAGSMACGAAEAMAGPAGAVGALPAPHAASSTTAAPSTSVSSAARPVSARAPAPHGRARSVTDRDDGLEPGHIEVRPARLRSGRERRETGTLGGTGAVVCCADAARVAGVDHQRVAVPGRRAP